MTPLPIAHDFSDPGLLREALTHRSAIPRSHGRTPAKRSNERLEFVGDRVLALLVAEWLAERFPDEAEGLLARRHAVLVAEPQLAAVGTAMGLTDHLVIAPNEARAGVGRSVTVLADAVEALLGAIYFDGGLEAARQFVRDRWRAGVEGQGQPPKHPKSALKEWLEARGHALPPFHEAERSGPAHAYVFSVTVSALGQTGAGSASTKQEAERQAAENLLRRLRS